MAKHRRHLSFLLYRTIKLLTKLVRFWSGCSVSAQSYWYTGVGSGDSDAEASIKLCKLWDDGRFLPVESI